MAGSDIVGMASVSQAPTSQSQLSPTSTPVAQPALLWDAAFLFVPFGLLAGLTMVIFKISASQKGIRDNFSPMSCSQQVPCRSCRFFNQNFYLKCAVNPTKVLTEQAVSCSDFVPYYEPKHEEMPR